MSDARADFRSRAARLEARARLDLLVRHSTAGLFFGLVPALVIAAFCGTIAFPFAAPAAAIGAAAIGLAVGTLKALLSPLDRTRLFIHADTVLGSRELASTAFELVGSEHPGAFADAIVEDAAKLLAGTPPRAILGKLRLPLAPFAVLAALLTAAGLLFPVDLRALLPRRTDRDLALAQIGEDLRKKGEKLADESRARDLGRSLELSQQLAQLGSDLAMRRIQPEDALDRMSEIESGLSREYQLRAQHAEAGVPRGLPGTGSGGPGGTPGRAGEPGTSPNTGKDGEGSAAEPQGDKALEDLGDALDRLRQAQRELGEGGSGETGQAQAPSRPRRQRDLQGQQGAPGLPPGQGDSGSSKHGGEGSDRGGAGAGPENPGQTGESGGSGIGSLPAPRKRGAPAPLIQGSGGPSLHAQGDSAGGDSTRLLARSLPEWTGSRLSEGAILNQYSRQAESALARDEVPLKLRQSVKEYFTVIGISK